MANSRILIFGVTGTLGHTILTEMSLNEDLNVYGTARSVAGLTRWLAPQLSEKILTGIDADNYDSIIRAVVTVKPDVVINCIGIIKQLEIANDPLKVIPINALFPHRIADLCSVAGARMIHISTDCVFDGKKGNYNEADPSDAKDLYGRSKYLGEVEYPHCVTLRTSIIGHELGSKLALVEWFLAREGAVKGYTGAIYSGLTTVELSHIIEHYVLPNQQLQGLYQVSSEPISKYDLLKLIAKRYGKVIEIEPYDQIQENRSLNSARFRDATGYNPPPWPDLVERMYEQYISSYRQRVNT